MKTVPSNEAPSYVEKPVQVKGNAAWYGMYCVALQHCTLGVCLFAIRWPAVLSRLSKCKAMQNGNHHTLWFGVVNIISRARYGRVCDCLQ